MNSSELRPVRFSLAHFLTLLVCMVSVGVSYGSTTTQVQELKSRVVILEESTLEQLKSLNEGVVQLRVDLAKVSQDLGWVKDTLKELEKEG